jgi:hypothetical protein
MRSMAVALESYMADWNKYPADETAYNATFGVKPYTDVPAAEIPRNLRVLTTPIAFMTSIPRDAFKRSFFAFWNTDPSPTPYAYSAATTRIFWLEIQSATAPAGHPRGHRQAEWVLYTYGPDREPSAGENLALGLEYAITRPLIDLATAWGTRSQPNIYDPTNGTMSWGDIARTGP